MKLFTFINGGIEYDCHRVARSERHGVSLLLETKSNNWIVANGVNVQSEKDFVLNEGKCYGDWNHGHYFMEHKEKAIMYFNSIKEEALMEVGAK